MIDRKDSFTESDTEVLEYEVVYKGYYQVDKYLIRHRLFKGGWGKPIVREVFRSKEAVGVVLFDPAINKLILIEQFRIGVYGLTDRPWLFELVAGIREDKSESIEEVAYREAKEETGLDILELLPIGAYWVSPGSTTGRMSLFCGRVEIKQDGGIFGLGEEGEDIRVHALTLEEVYQALEQGLICNGMTLIGLQWFKLHEQEIKKKWGQQISSSKG